MKKSILIWLFIILVGSPIFAQSFQDVVEVNTDVELDEICKSALGFTATPREIDEAINEIVETAGLNKTVFKLQQCSNIENAIAKMITEDGKEVRYIIYDADFIQRLINETSSEWTGKFVLAHEIGHHLYGHSLNNGSSNHEYELDADYFAGRALSILGASLEETLKATSILPERASSSHPARVDRVKKTEEGWNSVTNKAITIKVKKEDVDEIAKTIVGEAKLELRSSNLNDSDYSRVLQGLTLARTKYYNGYTEDIRYLEAICYTGLNDEESAMQSYINYFSIENIDKNDRLMQLSELFAISTSKKSSYFTNPNVLYHITKAYYAEKNYDKVIDYGKQFTPYSEDSAKKSEINKLVGLSEYKRIGLVKKVSIEESIIKGENYLKNQEYEKAFEIFKNASDKNNAKAQFLIGDLYLNGKGTLTNENLAVQSYLKSAQQGNSDAQNAIGYLYMKGIGVSKDYDNASLWLSKAVGQNNMDAVSNLSKLNLLIEEEKNTKKDIPVVKVETEAEIIAKKMIKADYYFEQEMYSDAYELYFYIASKGDAKAQFRVGWMYYKGKGITKNKDTAVDWWRISAKKGNIDAINYLTRLGKW